MESKTESAAFEEEKKAAKDLSLLEMQKARQEYYSTLTVKI